MRVAPRTSQLPFASFSWKLASVTVMAAQSPNPEARAVGWGGMVSSGWILTVRWIIGVLVLQGALQPGGDDTLLARVGLGASRGSTLLITK